MATREMAIALPIFIAERLKILHKSAPLSVQSFYNHFVGSNKN